MAPLRPLLAALLVLGICAPAAGAAQYTVTSPADDGPGSLRAALLAVAATEAADEITVSVPEIALASALPPLGDGTALDGAGARLVPATGSDPVAALTIGGRAASVRDLRVDGFPAGALLTGDAHDAALLALTLRDNSVGVRDDGHAGTVRVGGPDGDAVRISGGTTGVLARDAVRVRFAHIDGTSGLALDRGGDGPTPNAPGGAANHPVIDTVATALVATRVTGRLMAAPGPATVDLHAAGPCTPPARGALAGQLAAVDVEVGPDGTAAFAVTVPALPEGTALTAVATSTETTSEPAPCVRTSAPPAAVLPAPPASTPLPLAGAARPLAALVLDRRRVRPGLPARLTVTLARAAVVEVWLARRRSGRLVDGRCRPTRSAPPGAPRCRRAVPAGAIVRHLAAGASTLRVPIRLDGRALPPGRYRLTVRALEPLTAATLDERRARFRIVP